MYDAKCPWCKAIMRMRIPSIYVCRLVDIIISLLQDDGQQPEQETLKEKDRELAGDIVSTCTCSTPYMGYCFPPFLNTQVLSRPLNIST